MKITVKLGSSLRPKAPDFEGGEGTVELPAGAVVQDLLRVLDIAADEVNLMYRNHRLVTSAAGLHDGDRLALFPPNFIHFHQFYLERSDE
jgi:molybdopterin converting factor small subunit